MDGRSLRPILEGIQIANWRQDFEAQYVSGSESFGPIAEKAEAPASGDSSPPPLEIPSYRALRTQTHLYVEWNDPISPAAIDDELYDLKTDPYELRNLLATPAGRAANAALTATLKARLAAIAGCTGAACR